MILLPVVLIVCNMTEVGYLLFICVKEVQYSTSSFGLYLYILTIILCLLLIAFCMGMHNMHPKCIPVCGIWNTAKLFTTGMSLHQNNVNEHNLSTQGIPFLLCIVEYILLGGFYIYYSKQALRRLKSVLYESLLDDTSSEECSICLETFSKKMVSKLDCGHTYHTLCIKKWFSENEQARCPLCRMLQSP